MNYTDVIYEDEIPSNLLNILFHDSLKWIFVGGKGGVGKTTVSCGLAIQLAKVNDTVLLLSTDPAHSISDAFKQKFSKSPTKVEGFDNLFAMEVDADTYDENKTLFGHDDESETVRFGNNLLKVIATAFPGVDESLSYVQIMKLINSMDFSIIVFDTASTGHTLKLINFPMTMEKALVKVLEFKDKTTPYHQEIRKLCGPDVKQEDITQKIQELLNTIRSVNQQFQNPDKTTFICVCIAEFLSLYETERFYQELTKNKIDSRNIVVNQLYINNGDSAANCKRCSSRRNSQITYLHQINDLYSGFHITKLPLLEKEVQGVDDLKEFSNYLMDQSYAFHNA